LIYTQEAAASKEVFGFFVTKNPEFLSRFLKICGFFHLVDGEII
jgi:hypothetical protein